ncbi:MAG: hypothetical protein ABSE36_18460 [Terracidiphilus sp.]|jgi:hypothetical protein
MSETEIDGLVAYVDDLLKATSEGKIEWTSVNSTTFMWNRTTPPLARLELQRVIQIDQVTKVVNGLNVPTPERRNMQILTVHDLSRNGMNVTINGAQDPRINEKLGSIYDSISGGIVGKKMDFLKSTLPL